MADSHAARKLLASSSHVTRKLLARHSHSLASAVPAVARARKPGCERFTSGVGLTAGCRCA